MFKRLPFISQANALAAWMPNDKYVFGKKNLIGSQLRNTINGLAHIYFDANDQIVNFQDNYDIEKTTIFIEDWERAVGIPDMCFSGDGSLEDRRLHVLVKLASLGIQTSADFVELAQLFGVSVQVKSGIDGPFVPPITFINDTAARFTIVVLFALDAGAKFTYTFPIPFGDQSIAILECLFSQLNPENTQVIFQQV